MEQNTKLELAADTIRALLVVVQQPLSEQNYIDRVETAEAAEIVLVRIGK